MFKSKEKLVYLTLVSILGASMCTQFCLTAAFAASEKESSRSPSHEGNLDQKAPEDQKLENDAVEAARLDDQQRNPQDPKVLFVAFTEAEAELVHIKDIPATILSEHQLKKQVEKITKTTSRILSFSVYGMAGVLSYYYQDITDELSGVNEWVGKVTDTNRLLRKFFTGSRAKLLPPLVVYFTLDGFYRYFLMPSVDRLQSFGARRYLYRKNGINAKSVEKAHQIIMERAVTVCASAGAQRPVVSTQSLAVLYQDVTRDEIDSGRVKLYLDHRMISGDEFAQLWSGPVLVFASLQCEAKPFELTQEHLNLEHSSKPN